MNRLHHLDALRGLAAICVVGYHLFTYNGGSDSFSAGYLAVDFFFALSGFVMAACYDRRFAEGLSVRAFLRLRLRRLWFAAAIGTVLGFFALVIGIEPQPSQLLLLASGLLFIPNLAAPQLFVLNVVVWSLFFELIANLVHARAIWRLTTRTLATIAMVSLVLLLVAVVDAGSLDIGHRPENFMGGFPRVIFSYTLGILLFRSRWRPQPSPLLVWSVLPCALIAASLFDAGVARDLLFVACINPVVILIAARAIDRGRARMIADGLGALSYPLYAVHVPVILLVRQYEFSMANTMLAIALTAVLTALATEPGIARRLRGKLSLAGQNRSCQNPMPPI